MSLSEQTRAELRSIRSDVDLPQEYLQFMVRWIAFNRAYNELRFDEEESYRVLGVGDDLRKHWTEVIPQARQLVSLECIGGDHVTNQSLLRPTRRVKSATIFLRYRLDRPSFPECANDPRFCRANKVSMCSPVNVDPWNHSELAALLSLIYQVRCNLFHGEQNLSHANVQTNNDTRLLGASIEVLNSVFSWLC